MTNTFNYEDVHRYCDAVDVLRKAGFPVEPHVQLIPLEGTYKCKMYIADDDFFILAKLTL